MDYHKVLEPSAKIRLLRRTMWNKKKTAIHHELGEILREVISIEIANNELRLKNFELVNWANKDRTDVEIPF